MCNLIKENESNLISCIIMRTNGLELYTSLLKSTTPSIEARLQYRSPNGTFRDSSYHERYFRLFKNLLFYFKINEFGIVEKEPVGLLILENCTVQVDYNSDSFGFQILYLDEPDRLHNFSTRTEEDCNEWVETLTKGCIQYWRNKYKTLQLQVTSLRNRNKFYDNQKPSTGDNNNLFDVLELERPGSGSSSSSAANYTQVPSSKSQHDNAKNDDLLIQF